MLKKRYNLIISILLMIVCFITSSVLIFLSTNRFLDNAQVMGERIAENLANIEEIYISKYDTLFTAIEMEIEEQRENNVNSSVIVKNISDVFSRFEKVLSIDKIEMKIVIDGKIYNSNGEVLNENYKESQWYNDVIEANGNLVYTDAYIDEDTGEDVISIAKQNIKTQDIMVIDIMTDKIANWPTVDNMPENSRYYICDSTSKILHKNINELNIDDEKNQEYVTRVFNEIKAGEHEKANSFVRSITGEKRGVYYAESSNGWTFIVTVPYKYLLGGMEEIITAYVVSIVLFMILTIYLVLNEKREERKKELYNKITKALGESYYALYLVNLEKKSYSMLKASKYVEKVLKKEGNYSEFIECVEDVIEKDAYKEFKKTFSIENIRKLVKNNVKSFGGDFKRIFNGELRWVSVEMLYDKSDDNKNEIVLAFKDVNDEKEKELEKAQIIQDAIETNKQATDSKNKFFANMSHDMKTPLNAIINFSDIAKEQIDNKEKLEDYLKKINISSKQLLELINNILNISKIDEGIENIDKKEFNILEKLQETLSVFEEQAKIQDKKFHVVYNIKNEYVISDWGKIRQIVNNIVSNSLKYTLPKGNIVVEVNEIEGKFVSKYEILVGDDGIGMSKEFIDKLYTPFSRETRFYSKEIQGTGLGMVIVQNNIQMLNGQIEVKSKPKEGTVFRITLPLEKTTKSEIQEEEIKNEENEIAGSRILVVEDNELNMQITSEVLEMNGAIITKARNGKEAVNTFKESKEDSFDVILMDIQMPEMDGFEATRSIRKLDRKDAKRIPIIAVTANSFAEDRIEAEKAGMNDYITKPINYKEFREVIIRYMKKGE